MLGAGWCIRTSPALGSRGGPAGGNGSRAADYDPETWTGYAFGVGVGAQRCFQHVAGHPDVPGERPRSPGGSSREGTGENPMKTTWS